MLTPKEVWDLSFLFDRLFQPRIQLNWISVFSHFFANSRIITIFSFMASQDPIQEVEGDYRNSKTSFVKGVRMPLVYVYKTGFEEFIDKFQTRIDDVFIVGIPRSGKI